MWLEVRHMGKEIRNIGINAKDSTILCIVEIVVMLKRCSVHIALARSRSDVIFVISGACTQQ
jgi:hypothetical protein